MGFHFDAFDRTRAGRQPPKNERLMSRKFKTASAFATALTFTFTLLTADGSGAAAEAKKPVVVVPAVTTSAEPANLLPEGYPAPAAEKPVAEAPLPPAYAPAVVDDNLNGLVAQHAVASDMSREMECMAGAIYFEAKSESLEGQLAVGRVIVNRARSGRFPSSYCGVVFQPSQFSFVRGNGMPAINRASHAWKVAVAIAQIAHDGSWSSPVEGALYFHAARVSPGWRLTRIARVDNHVFYR